MAADVRLIRSPIAVVGMALTTISAVVFLMAVLAHMFGFRANPYLGGLLFLVLPTFFVLGLLLIPLGVWYERRRRLHGKPASSVQWPRLDLNDPHQRVVVVIVLALTIANVVLVTLGAYAGVEYMDTVGFCGEVCHTSMKPEFRSHPQGLHAGATWTMCHVGPGAGSFVRSKLAGVRRVVAVARGTYSRPIIADPEDLVASRDTCERCHEAGKMRGESLRRMVEYADDEANTESATKVQLHVGGGHGGSVPVRGIHWHANPANRVEYIATDENRQTIPYVKVTDATGASREYVVDGVAPDVVAKGTRRVMECMDCHNRVGHPVISTPQRAVNEAMARGDIPASLPFVHREAVKLLAAAHPSEEAATAEIARSLRAFYQSLPAQAGAAPKAAIDQAIRGTQDLYKRNVFPDMSVTFGSYPRNIGHIDSPGCFRCHDDEHKSKDGKAIGQDCEMCHAIE